MPFRPHGSNTPSLVFSLLSRADHGQFGANPYTGRHLYLESGSISKQANCDQIPALNTNLFNFKLYWTYK